MERPRFSRLTGIIYIVSAVFGLIFSITGLAGLWLTRPQVTGGIDGTVALIGRALTATTSTLQVVDASLQEASTNLNLIHVMLDDVSGTLNGSKTTVNDTAGLVGTNMVNIVRQTQASLKSAGTNLKVVDDTLTVISRIPFIGANYKPDVPLQESFNRVSQTLDPLPASFTKISGELNDAAAKIDTLKTDLDTMAGQIDGIQTSIADARERVTAYNEILKDLQEKYDFFQTHLPTYLNVFYIGFTGMLVWMLMAQMAMLIHGLQLVS